MRSAKRNNTESNKQSLDFSVHPLEYFMSKSQVSRRFTISFLEIYCDIKRNIFRCSESCFKGGEFYIFR